MLNSIEINLPQPNINQISTTDLGKNISNSTYYLSCWMTTAQIQKLKSEKVIFKNLLKKFISEEIKNPKFSYYLCFCVKKKKKPVCLQTE